MLLAEAVEQVQAVGESSGLLAQILVSLFSAIVGGAITFFLGLYLVSHTEWLRKLSGWEPYATILWEKRFAHYLRLAEMSHDLVGVSRYMSGDSTLLAARDKMSVLAFDLSNYSESRTFMTDQVVTNHVLDVLDAASKLIVKATSVSVAPADAEPNEDPISILKNEVQTLSQANQKLVSTLSSELKFLIIDWAESSRFEEITKALPKESFRKLMERWETKTQKSV